MFHVFQEQLPRAGIHGVGRVDLVDIIRALHNNNSLSLSGGFTLCRYLRPSSGREHTVV